MTTPTRQDRTSWTIEEYVRLEESDELRSELVRGRLVSEAQIIGEEGTLEGADVLPGLSIPLHEVLPE